MKLSIMDWDGKTVGEAELSDDIFGAEVRRDILARVVHWQLAKRRSGNHKTKEIGDVSGTTRKPHRQKGTGRARQGSLRSPQFRGGAVIFGPVVRDHGYSLPKKVRRLGMISALAARMAENKVTILDSFELSSAKTKDFVAKMGVGSVLMIGGEAIGDALRNATGNLHHVNVLPGQGANVYDILRHDRLILSREGVEYLEQRLAVR